MNAGRSLEAPSCTRRRRNNNKTINSHLGIVSNAYRLQKYGGINHSAGQFL